MNDKEFTRAYLDFENQLRLLINKANLPIVVKLAVVREAERGLTSYVNKMATETEEDEDVHSD